MKIYQIEVNDTIPYNVILYAEEPFDSLYSYLLKFANDYLLKTNLIKSEEVIATDRNVIINVGGKK